MTLLPAVSAITTRVVTLEPEDDDSEDIPRDTYDLARSGWKREPGERFGKQRAVLGSLGGSPSCLDDDRRPGCPSYSGTTEFAAAALPATEGSATVPAPHLEEGIDRQAAMNLGGRLGYVFVCRPCSEGAFLTG
ncbi:hypothetical protein ACIBSV_37645 [Embleya sp. NPDC050154]|uniref:hypothetical protein n=1 Tax=Embleya sp. NPDC050154 TaxID=3363988 RepID=UPI003790B51F